MKLLWFLAYYRCLLRKCSLHYSQSCKVLGTYLEISSRTQAALVLAFIIAGASVIVLLVSVSLTAIITALVCSFTALWLVSCFAWVAFCLASSETDFYKSTYFYLLVWLIWDCHCVLIIFTSWDFLVWICLHYFYILYFVS